MNNSDVFYQLNVRFGQKNNSSKEFQAGIVFTSNNDNDKKYAIVYNFKTKKISRDSTDESFSNYVESVLRHRITPEKIEAEVEQTMRQYVMQEESNDYQEETGRVLFASDINLEDFFL